MIELISNPLVLIVFGIAVCVIIYLFAAMKPKGLISQKKTKDKDQVNDIIPPRKSNKYYSVFFDSVTSRWFQKVILTPEVMEGTIKTWRSLGMEFNAFGVKSFLITRYNTYADDGSAVVHYKPLQLMLDSTHRTPTELYNIIQQAWVKRALPMQVDKSNLQKLMPVLIWTGAILFLAFMWTQS